MQNDPIPPKRRAVFDEFVYNNLPRHLLHVKAAGNSSCNLVLEVVSASQLPSIFKSELDNIFLPPEKQNMSDDKIKDELRDLLKFAIFSHRWFQEGEPTLPDIKSGAPSPPRGYDKLTRFCKTARKFNCKLAWSDTCCIDKTSSAELDEAIRAMFNWYRLAYICIVHLSDAESISFDELKEDVWFTRGWTLQELLAPKRMKFYGKNWNELTVMKNDKDHVELMKSISKITNIPPDDLRDFRPGTIDIRKRMSWASRRTTTRTEDIAYSLIGVFDVDLPIAYGEGTWAFYRLMEVIIRRCDEWGIFAWAGRPSSHHSRTSAIPHSPACYHIINVDRFPSEMGRVHGDTSFTLSRQGLFLTVMVAIGDVQPKVNAPGDGCYVFTVKPSHAGDTFMTVDVQSSAVTDIAGYEWALGILNYREVEPKGEYGKLEGRRSYVSYLLHRHPRAGEAWTRVPTDNILIVDTLFESESREPLCGLWL